MSDHIVPTRVYYVVFAVLMVGTYLTVQAAYLDLGPFNTLVALGIAVIKATLVVLFFIIVDVHVVPYRAPAQWPGLVFTEIRGR